MIFAFLFSFSLSNMLVADFKGFQIGIEMISGNEVSIGNGDRNAFFEYPESVTNFTLTDTITFQNGEYPVAEVANYAFSETPFTKIVFPASVRKIGEYCFYKCPNLEILSISKCKIVVLPKYIFAKCPNLETILCSKQIHEIGEGAFSKTGITFIHVQAHFYSAAPKAFYGSKLTEVDLSTSSLIEISESMFEKCTDLTDVVFSNTLEVIGARAFALTGIVKLTLPSSIREIHEEAFSNCPHLEFIDLSSCKTLILPDSLFHSCGYLQIAILPDHLVEILKFTFANTSITYFKPTEHLEIIGESAFQGCKRLSIVDLSYSNCYKIHSKAFSDCITLASFFPPKKLKYIGEYAFQHTKAYEFNLEFIEHLGEGAFANINTLKIIDLSKSPLKQVPDSLFRDSNSLNSIKLPQTLEKIGTHAFTNTHIRNVVLPNSLMSIGENAFQNCEDLIEADLGFTNVTEIPTHLFFQCSKLTKVILPPFITAAADSAFLMCAQLSSVYYLGSNSLPSGLSVPKSCQIYVSPKYRSKTYGSRQLNVIDTMNEYIPRNKKPHTPAPAKTAIQINNEEQKEPVKARSWLWDILCITAVVCIIIILYQKVLVKSILFRKNFIHPVKRLVGGKKVISKADQYTA